MLRHLRDELSATAVRILAYFCAIAVIAITVWWIAQTSIVEAAARLVANEAKLAELLAPTGRACKLCSQNSVPTNPASEAARHKWTDSSGTPKLRGGIIAK